MGRFTRQCTGRLRRYWRMTKWIGDHPAVGKTRRNMVRIERWVVKQERILVKHVDQMHAVVAIAQKYPNFSAIVQIKGPRWRRFSIEQVAEEVDLTILT